MEHSMILRFNDDNIRDNFSKDSVQRCYSLPAGINTEQGSNNQIDIEMKKLCSCIWILRYVLSTLRNADLTHVIYNIHINIFSSKDLCNRIMEITWINCYP